MSDVVAPQKTVEFTIVKKPQRIAQQKTIQRLMRMQPEVQKGLTALARRRRNHDNIKSIRAGRPWVNRATTTKLTHVEPGETFTLTISPQIMPDIKSVEQFLKAKAV